MVRSQPDSINHTSNLFVWGTNDNSELGLSEDLVESNKQFHHKTSKHIYMSSPIYHTQFGSMVHQIACGNINSAALCINPSSKASFVVMMGTSIVMRDEYEEKYGEKNLFYKEELMMLQDIPSMPYQIEFDVPVVKVACGDCFNALLTAEGKVYTWGHNKYQQLGIDRQDIMV